MPAENADGESRNEIWASIGLTINTGNYNSLRIDAGRRVSVVEGEDSSELWTAVWDEIDAELAKKVAEAKKDLEEE